MSTNLMTIYSPKANLPNPILTYMDHSVRLEATILIELMLPREAAKEPTDTHHAVVTLAREGKIFASLTMSIGIDEFKDQLLKGSIMEEIEPIIEEYLDNTNDTPIKLVSAPTGSIQ